MTTQPHALTRYVPRTLRDDGMITASEVSHYTHLNLTQYVKATDDAAQRETIRRLEGELESQSWKISPAMAQAKIDELNAKLTASEQQVGRLREALHDACLTYAAYGDNPPQKWLDVLKAQRALKGDV